MYPISDLTTFCRKTTGDVPPKLVGASTTVVGSKVYLYGGRLVAERRMVTDIYMFDLETFNWEKIPQGPEVDFPRARYFHSTDTWNNHLIIFGGMALQSDSANPDDLYVLNDVRFFNLSTRRWLPATADHTTGPTAPKARYAHLSSVAANRLFIIGGQDLSDVWLDDIHVFDLKEQTWVHRREYARHCGTYRSVAVSSNLLVRSPQDEIRSGSATSKSPSSSSGSPAKNTSSKGSAGPEALIHLPYSALPTDEYPSDMYLFSNYNFTNVKREFEVFRPTPGGDFTISDQSSSMKGASFPPGLRFPAGAILGTHFIVAGTYLTQSYQSFSIWALDLVTMVWSRIDPGSALSSGSWFRSCLWPEANKFFVFGNSHGNLAADYNRRLLSWDHVACIDLEAFGIYQYPPLSMSIDDQELALAAIEEELLSDFEIICEDGRKISCSRKILEERWPWFKQQRVVFLQSVSRATNALPSSSSHDVPLPEYPNISKEPRPDPRLTSRSLHLSESYPVSLAFLQYFYTQSLVTPLQHAPAVLSQLLLLSSTYNLGHLQSLVKHAMHRALTYATSVGIYGVSTLCNCRSLQIRALRVVMLYSQKRPSGRSSRDKDSNGNNGNSRGEGSGAAGGSGANTSPDMAGAARPRGMSDASFINKVTNEAQQSAGGAMRGYSSSDSTRDASIDITSIADVVLSFPATPTELVFAHPSTGAPIKDASSPQIQLKCDESPSTVPLCPSSPSLSVDTSSEGLSKLKTWKKAIRHSSSSPLSSPASPPSDLPLNLLQPPSVHTPPISRGSSPSPVEESLLAHRRLSSRKHRPPHRLHISRNPEYLHKRTYSSVSTHTDQELCAVAEMMSPIIADFSSHYREHHGDQIGLAIDERMNDKIDAYIQEHKHARSKKTRHSSDSESATASSRPTSANLSSVYEDSEVESALGAFGDRAYLAPSSTPYPAFHLPSPFTIGTYRDSDTPSLTSSASSFSSGLTRCRTPSMFLHSPPATPSTSDTSNNNLSIIEEHDGDQSNYYTSPSPSPEPLAFASPPADEFFEPDLSPSPDYRGSSSSLPQELQYQELLRQSAKSPASTITDNSYTTETMVTIKSGGSAFSRLLPKGKSKERVFLKVSENVSVNRRIEVWDEIIPYSRPALATSESVWSKSTTSLRSEDKKKKKELAKEQARAKRDKLAAELKAKQLKKEADQDKVSINSKRSQGKRVPSTWEEEGAMYNMQGLVL